MRESPNFTGDADAVSEELKSRVRRFWEDTPCGTREISEIEGSREFFDRLEKERYEREGFIDRFAGFAMRKGEKVLEVGIGTGTDFIRFARAGARLTGVDLTPRAVDLVRKRLALEGLSAEVRVADAEQLPFADASFDFVYSWGVVHHTADTRRAVGEIIRVTRPGGRVCVMIYHRFSLVSFQCWILNALLRGRPWRTLSDVIWNHIESPGTKAFSIGEARRMFSALADLEISPIVTPYDLRVSRSRYLPDILAALVPERLGWFLVVTGRKPGMKNETRPMTNERCRRDSLSRGRSEP